MRPRLVSPPASSQARAEQVAVELFRASVAVVLALNVVNLFAVFQQPWADPQYAWLLLDSESNISAWFSSGVLLVAAGLALLCCEVDDVTRRKGWGTITAALGLMSMEEIAGLHERLDTNLSGAVDTSGPLYFVWIVPAAILVVVLLFVLRPFVRQLPRASILGLLAGSATYLSGALVMESVGGAWVSSNGRENVEYLLLASVEENLELVGSLLLAVVLGRHVFASPASSRIAGPDGAAF